jgi:DGQHR domain-containing protein
MITVKYIKVDQPIGRFYLTALPAAILVGITTVDPRDLDNDTGVQRPGKNNRIREISEYCSDPDATFPTAIVVSVYQDKQQYCTLNEEKNTITIDESQIIGQIIDGQHRLKGLAQSSNIDNFEIPVVFMFDMTPKDNAYVFSIINSKQTKVNPSHIADLLSLTDERSPQKTAHEVAKALNSMPESPFYMRLRMLGYNAPGQDSATLSQGTFTAQLVTLISKNPDDDARRIKRHDKLIGDNTLPLRDYFIEEQDEVILKLMLNCFNAVRKVFPDEYNKPKENILWKTTGFSAIIKSFPELYHAGERRHDLTEAFFTEAFEKVKSLLGEKGISLSGAAFAGGGKQLQQQLAQLIVEAMTTY